MSSEPGDQETRAAGGGGGGCGKAAPGHLRGLCRWDICRVTCSSTGPALLPEAVAAAELGLGQSSSRVPSYLLIVKSSSSTVTVASREAGEVVRRPYPRLASRIHVSGGCRTTWKPGRRRPHQVCVSSGSLITSGLLERSPRRRYRTSLPRPPSHGSVEHHQSVVSEMFQKGGL